MITIQLPHLDKIDRSSGPKSEGFAVNDISYSSNVFQRSFAGADAESSREEVWTVNWEHLQYATPEEVATGVKNTIGEIRDFYKSAQINKVLWTPFEIGKDRVWSIVPNSLSVKNPAGCLFSASINLKFLYSLN